MTGGDLMDYVKEMSCIKSTEYSIHTRRCFITSEYCSQQANIQKERQKLHEKSEINAFVIMNFSSMSDIMYVSRIKPFIEGLKKHLFIDSKKHRIACCSKPSNYHKPSGFTAVKTIHVHRADSNPVSSNIICNRICQLIQIADLIIVDVSVESANVFCELGLATAFNKLILPICFSESFYAMKLPDRLEEAIKMTQERQIIGKKISDIESPTVAKEADPALKALEKHIDCYPWRRKLFEHFGIRHQKYVKDSKCDYPGVRYIDPAIVFSEKYGFSDYQYNRFPYDAPVDKNKKLDEKTNPSVGKTIYNWLQVSYNQASSYSYNTLVLYTMDRILNKNQAGQCIINFYHNITKPMMDNHCFCGDRVAILGQPNIMWDDPKDNKTGKELFYGVSDIIQIGMDEATFRAERGRIKTSDYMFYANQNEYSKGCSSLKETIDQIIKTHIRIRSIPVNPETPLYVIQFQNGIQQNLEKDVVKKIAAQNKASTDERYFFCLYHVMLDTLRYTNEIVVDLSSNSIQAMFWLGAAHGANIQAITVRHEMSEKEKEWSKSNEIQIDRPVFDISGLWTAMLRYNETETFYKQLALIQQGIEQRSKLMLPDTELAALEAEFLKQFYSPSDFRILSCETQVKPIEHTINEAMGNEKGAEDANPFDEKLTKKYKAESYALESYYRDCFWRHMLRDNQLHLFLPMSDTQDTIGPRLQVIKWDVDAVAELSNYLSKRKVIGKYQLDTLRPDEFYGKNNTSGKTNALSENFISIGEQTYPFANTDFKSAISLAEHINQIEGLSCKVCYLHKRIKVHLDDNSRCYPVQYRGFCTDKKKPEGGAYKQFLTPECTICPDKTKCCDMLSTSNCTTSDPPSEIRIILKELVKDSNDIKCSVEFPEAENINNRFYIRFEHLVDATTVASIHCMPAPIQNKVNLQKNPNTSTCALTSSLSLLVSSQIILKHDDHTSSGLNGYYNVEFDNNCNSWLLSSVLNKFELQLNDNGTAILHLINPEFQQPITNTQTTRLDNNSNANDNKSFEILGQLLLWREIQNCAEKGTRDYKYHVSLVGASGPATKALTALLVDKEQKKRILNKNNIDLDQCLPLVKLQTHIRNQLFVELNKNLETALRHASNRAPIIYLTMCYLSTLLYQYFLPFLSHADEKRIQNSLEAFLLTLDSKDDGNLEKLIRKHKQTVLRTVMETLKSFRGVEALYSIKVSAANNSNSTDNRTIERIQEYCSKTDSPEISCLFIQPQKKYKLIGKFQDTFTRFSKLLKHKESL